jgi:hypothetical protein
VFLNGQKWFKVHSNPWFPLTLSGPTFLVAVMNKGVQIKSLIEKAYHTDVEWDPNRIIFCPTLIEIFWTDLTFKQQSSQIYRSAGTPVLLLSRPEYLEVAL